MRGPGELLGAHSQGSNKISLIGLTSEESQASRCRQQTSASQTDGDWRGSKTELPANPGWGIGGSQILLGALTRSVYQESPAC